MIISSKSFQYRLTKSKKNQIAQNLIDVLEKDINLSQDTRSFIINWIMTGPNEKRKAFFDVWEIVLKNYFPMTRPILFRACSRLGRNSKIASFTGRLECAKRISKQKGYLLICDTSETLRYERKFRQQGDYKNTFYPLIEVLNKIKNSGGSEFSEGFLNKYIGEDEYIMRINLDETCSFKWIGNDA